MRKPSKEATRKARLNRLFKEQKERDGYLKILKITGSEVVFRYGNYEIGFLSQEGRVTRDGRSYTYLAPEDWVFLFSLAQELMSAAIAGYKKNKQTVGKTIDTRQESFQFFPSTSS